MKKSINQWSFPAGMSLREIMELARKTGYDCFEPAFDETGELCLGSTDQEILAVRDMARDIGLPLCSLASGLYWRYSPTDNDPAVRARSLEIIRRQLEAAKLLEVDTILVVPGSVKGGDDPVDYDVAYDRALEAMEKAKDDARDIGVSIGVENVWNNFLLSPLEMRDFIDKVNSPWVGAYLDVGNLIKFGFPEMWVKILGSRIKKVHVKDFKRDVGNFGGFVDLLSGDVDFPKVVKALEQAGYDGPLTAEMSAEGCFPEDIVRRTYGALTRILSTK